MAACSSRRKNSAVTSTAGGCSTAGTTSPGPTRARPSTARPISPGRYSRASTATSPRRKTAATAGIPCPAPPGPARGEPESHKPHPPGAVFASLDRDLSAPKNGRNGRHPLPDPAVFAQWLSSVGMQPTDRVVCYDASNGAMAARLWWLQRWIGHKDVAVLDGGFAKWTREGLPVTSEVPSFPATSYPDEIDGNRAV